MGACPESVCHCVWHTLRNSSEHTSHAHTWSPRYKAAVASSQVMSEFSLGAFTCTLSDSLPPDPFLGLPLCDPQLPLPWAHTCPRLQIQLLGRTLGAPSWKRVCVCPPESLEGSGPSLQGVPGRGIAVLPPF